MTVVPTVSPTENPTANPKERASRNRTLGLTETEVEQYGAQLLRLSGPVVASELTDRILHQDLINALPWLPDQWVDLLILDPPYNLTKWFDGTRFGASSAAKYRAWMEAWFLPLLRVLKPTASIYVCGDWRSSGVLEALLGEHLIIRNRITWERDKGRGSQHNWKNCAEDIWFCTVSPDYCFNAEAVRLRRRVRAPYRNAEGAPKDWQRSAQGDYRLTGASNLWTEMTVPFWSMPENTDHPTQKPEKLIAKLMLASSNPGDVVFDPFLGSGTTAAVARKLDRHFVGIERELTYCCLAAKRWELADRHRRIQGYDGAFQERNAT
jgi:site-specific DNA-methyltransferase (adenine-specific)